MTMDEQCRHGFGKGHEKCEVRRNFVAFVLKLLVSSVIGDD